MKDLIKAKHLYDDIISLQEEIYELESEISKTIKGVPKLALKIDVLNEDEDNEYEHKRVWINGHPFIEEDPKGISLEINDSELVVMIGSLVKYKTDKRQQLINEFNQLSIKLKL